MAQRPVVYILSCDNGQYYVGSTTNLDLRLREIQLYKWSHAKKEALVKGDITKLKELSKK